VYTLRKVIQIGGNVFRTQAYYYIVMAYTKFNEFSNVGNTNKPQSIYYECI